MVESQSGADIPLAELDLIFNICGWLNVPVVVGKLELQCRAGIKLRGIGDLILQVFVHGVEESVNAGLPIVSAMMPRQVGARVSFAVTTILIYDHWSGLRVRGKQRRRVPHARGKTQEDVCRKGVGEVYLAACFTLRAVLPLARLLLDEFIRHQ